jgi:predicted secreted protein
MKKLLAALFLLTLASSTPAKANSLITASVYNRDLNGNVCSTTQSASTSLSLACGSTSGNTGYVAVNASLGTLSGYVDESIQPVSTNNGLNDTFETESYTASLTGTYMLTGGTGSGYVS